MVEARVGEREGVVSGKHSCTVTAGEMYGPSVRNGRPGIAVFSPQVQIKTLAAADIGTRDDLEGWRRGDAVVLKFENSCWTV